MAGVGMVRLGKELKMLADEPPPGVCAWPVEDCITHLQAQIQGPEDTPYERGTFLLDIQIPDRYPFEPPKVRFVTPIYHPNIDSGGRICLDTLKMRPAGSWAPSMNVPTLLTTIRLLMAHPNGDDGLMPDITELFLKNPSRFADVARAHVEQHARQDTSQGASEGRSSEGPSAPPPDRKDQKAVNLMNERTPTSTSAVTQDESKAQERSDEESLAQGEVVGGGACSNASSAVSKNERTDRGMASVDTARDAGKGSEEEIEHTDAAAVDGSVSHRSNTTGEVEERTGSRRNGGDDDGSNVGGSNGSDGRGPEEADCDSDDGEWSDSDDDDSGEEAEGDGRHAKRARPAP